MSKSQASQKKTPAWKAQFRMQAKLADEAIERGMRLQALSVAAQLFNLSNAGGLLSSSDEIYQWLMHGHKKPTMLRVVSGTQLDMGAGVPGDEGC